MYCAYRILLLCLPVPRIGPSYLLEHDVIIITVHPIVEYTAFRTYEDYKEARGTEAAAWHL